VAGALAALPFAFMAYRLMRTIWSRQDVIFDLDIEVAQVIERRPFKTRVRSLPFSAFLSVALITFEEHRWAVALRHAKADHVWLGLGEGLTEAEKLAERVAAVSKLPLIRVKDEEVETMFRSS
jgi:hypothetical protein